MRAKGVVLVASAIALWSGTVGVAWLRVGLNGKSPSRSSGTVAQGKLEDGHPIPPWGPGFITYSFIGSALGRQYVNGSVSDALVATFAASVKREPRHTFVVGETGWAGGGRFRPHRTHQNGLSVDVFMPVVDAQGKPAKLGTWPWNKFGYGLELDANGRLGNLRIDFEAVAAFLRELQIQANSRGLAIQKVIIAPEYVPLLLATPSGQQFGAIADVLSRRPAWVRHDEHVHVDFAPRTDGPIGPSR